MKISKDVKLQFKFVNVWFVITKFVDFCLMKETIEVCKQYKYQTQLQVSKEEKLKLPKLIINGVNKSIYALSLKAQNVFGTF